MDMHNILTPQEMELLALFRSLGKDDQHKVMLAAEALKSTEETRHRRFGIGE